MRLSSAIKHAGKCFPAGILARAHAQSHAGQSVAKKQSSNFLIVVMKLKEIAIRSQMKYNAINLANPNCLVVIPALKSAECAK